MRQKHTATWINHRRLYNLLHNGKSNPSGDRLPTSCKVMIQTKIGRLLIDHYRAAAHADIVRCNRASRRKMRRLVGLVQRCELFADYQKRCADGQNRKQAVEAENGN